MRVRGTVKQAQGRLTSSMQWQAEMEVLLLQTGILPDSNTRTTGGTLTARYKVSSRLSLS